MKEGKAQTDFPLSLKLDDDKVLVFATNSSPILDSNFNMRGAMATFNDESALQEANGVLLEMMDKLRKSQDEVNKQNSELKRLATRDPMTNCLNRRAFFERMDKAFTLAQSEKKPLGCVMVDIDHFKKINDEHGHGVGDKVLKMVAKLLDSKFGNNTSICRYGGEEFCRAVAWYCTREGYRGCPGGARHHRVLRDHGHRNHDAHDGYRQPRGIRHRAGCHLAGGTRRPGG